MRAFLITGTDTGVGKTFIAYNLAYALKEKGIKVGYLKPVETDVRDLPADGSLLCSITGQEIKEAVPITYSLPLSPYAGILEEGKDFSLQELYAQMRRMQERYTVLMVEGAGGIAVPIKRDYDYTKLAKDWNLPVLIVARAGLGTINHTFLSVFYAKSMGLRVLGIVMNGFEGRDVSEKTNPRIVEELTGIKPLEVPRISGLLLPPDIRNALLNLIGL
ncbi:dethiobiotin synthase [Hydrogenobacter thermophilus]|uniref:dethiobiotin synthase n=1 Tax=Hydrogenobacter thermophilus TaxID=940 RepID=UPI0030F6B358